MLVELCRTNTKLSGAMIDASGVLPRHERNGMMQVAVDVGV
jgi:hypothetical protein